MSTHHHLKIPHEGLFVIGIILGLFVLALTCLAGSMSPRELLDGSLFRCCWRRSRQEEEEEPHTYPTINEFIFESNTDSAGFVELEQGQAQEISMNHVFPDLLAQEETEPSNDLNQPLL